jgi:hypothetical protein
VAARRNKSLFVSVCCASDMKKMTDQIFEVPRQALSPGTRPRACLLFPRAPITPPARPHAHPEAVRSTRYGRTARGCAVTEVRARCGPDRLFENRGPSIEFESTNTHSASARPPGASPGTPSVRRIAGAARGPRRASERFSTCRENLFGPEIGDTGKSLAFFGIVMDRASHLRNSSAQDITLVLLVSLVM